MASRPDELPESIIVGQFAGLRNTVSEERLGPNDLAIARNIDIDDAMQLRGRPGFEAHDASAYHSFREIAGRTFVVKDGVLGLLAEDRTHTALATVGTDPLSYTAVGQTVYISSVSWSGQISSTNAVTAWCIAGDTGQWISPVMTPTDTLGQIAVRQLRAPGLARHVEYYKGRIYLAVDKVLWHTELYLYGLVDAVNGFVQFEHAITMVRAVEDGIYVGTTAGLFFLKGTAHGGLVRTQALGSPVIEGSDVEVPTTLVHPSARQQPLPEGDSVVFVTQAGICVGLDNGVVYNLTQDRVKLPALTEGAALYRNDAGDSRYIYADAGGTAWAMNTRSGAVTEYENYTFNSFARVGDTYFAAHSGGLYSLGAADDDGTDIAIVARSGLLRFGGAYLSRLKAAYVTARTEGAAEMTLFTGEGAEYVYAVTMRELRTMKVRMGKGQRAIHFGYELRAAALDLDTIEFVPLVVKRRV